MKRILALVVLFMGVASILAQQPASTPAAPNPNELTAKSTPASDALGELARDQTADQAALNTKLQQAKYSLDQSNKALGDQIQTVQKDLMAKLNQDKKYKPMLDQIADLQKKLNENQTNASNAYQKDAGPLVQRVQSETAQVQGLIPVVKKENGFPDNATYSVETQKWTVPAAPKAPETPKK